jgi:hypothetical protein
VLVGPLPVGRGVSETVCFEGVAVTRYVGPSSLLDRRRIQLVITDGTMNSSPQGPIAIRDFSFEEARVLVGALEALLNEAS